MQARSRELLRLPWRRRRFLHGLIVGVLLALVAIESLLLIATQYALAPVGEATVAIGTLGLALATIALAIGTFGLVAKTADEMDQIRLQAAALTTTADLARASARPRVEILELELVPFGPNSEEPRLIHIVIKNMGGTAAIIVGSARVGRNAHAVGLGAPGRAILGPQEHTWMDLSITPMRPADIDVTIGIFSHSLTTGEAGKSFAVFRLRGPWDAPDVIELELMGRAERRVEGDFEAETRLVRERAGGA